MSKLIDKLALILPRIFGWPYEFVDSTLEQLVDSECGFFVMKYMKCLARNVCFDFDLVSRKRLMYYTGDWCPNIAT
uniref:Ubiquitin-like protease family profile domain-containing protein n=1 Tax=Nelumbo nucifera TaxID=4432 RepID=A0A822ZH40_NELNU|nr:TPA_asm: hypothetical protein HUJ06_000999 [Nelumbo nucifera]